MWADGTNDESGGVFKATPPSADIGPQGPGPGYHTGTTIPSDASSLSRSFEDDIRAMSMDGRTTAASVDVHDSLSTIYRSDRVIADGMSIASESFQSDASDYRAARDGNATQEEEVAVPRSYDESSWAIDSDSDDSDATIGDDDDFVWD